MPEPWLNDLKRKATAGAYAVKPKKKKTSAKAAKFKADVVFSRLIRSAGECEYCGARPPEVKLETAHWISRRYSNIRTDFDNAFCLCSAHHRMFTADPTGWSDWAILQRGRATYDRLREAANKQSEINWTDELTRLQQMERGMV